MQNLPAILVVEDDLLLQTFIEEALGDGGFEPTITAAGEEAITLLKEHKGRYRVLVTDINLEGEMDGWEVARLTREINPDFPVVYTSGTAVADWASKGVPNSIILSKPFASAQLLTAVANLLNAGNSTT